jgi:16S rRNA (uracil1498-N3)-methyltransferase
LLANLDKIATFPEWVQHQDGLKIFLDPHAKKALTALEPVNKKVILLTGPEGGFSPLERELAIENNFTPIRLGGRILRTETASLAALSAIQTLWGDFGNAN